MPNTTSDPHEQIYYDYDGVNPFTRLAQIWDVEAVNYDELYIYSGQSIADIADALEERFTDEADALGMTENGFLSDLLARALGNVNWYGLARSMFDELLTEAQGFRFTDHQYGNDEKRPTDTTHLNPSQWAKENGYTIDGDNMTNAAGDLLFFVLVFPED